jgi:hypothetical protein
MGLVRVGEIVKPYSDMTSKREIRRLADSGAKIGEKLVGWGKGLQSGIYCIF